MTTTFQLKDNTGLDSSVAQVWVAGWINGGSTNFQVLQSGGSFVGSPGSLPTGVPFFALADVETVSLSVATNGDDRLLFVVSESQPTALAINAAGTNPVQYTQYPYANAPGVAAPGPFDVFEFGMNAQDNVTAVSGFGLNLSFSVEIDGATQQYGADPNYTRAAIGTAYTAFVANEATSLPSATAFAELLYDSAINVTGAPNPPVVDNQFFAICDPNDMLASSTSNYSGSTSDPLAIYWDSTLAAFFKVGSYLSINLNANSPTKIYSGECTSVNGVPTYSLTGINGTVDFPMPAAGLPSAQYVFQQAFGSTPSPGDAQGDAGLLQDSIWEALCRGVAMAGVSTTAITNAESTTAWNDYANWYPAGTVCHIYSKFFHYSDIDGNDSRTSGKPPIYFGNSAYGFSMDENPLGPYSGGSVPSKTTQNVPDGSTVTIKVGPWDVVAA